MQGRKILTDIKTAPVAILIPGWTTVTRFAVGGLEAVGFDEQSDELVVVSSQGQGIFDPGSGERVYRDRSQDGYDWKTLSARRGDKPDAGLIRMSGIHGGQLRTVTDDGWTLQTVVYERPKTRLILGTSNYTVTASKLPPRDKWFVLGDACEFRVWGFSPTGNILIWSDEVDIHMLRRTEAI